MKTVLETLKQEAVKKYGKIYPCAGKTWEECVTKIGDVDALWLNDAAGSTHVFKSKKLCLKDIWLQFQDLNDLVEQKQISWETCQATKESILLLYGFSGPEFGL
jgi:hypothetical protein